MFHVLVHYHELALKGRNRKHFEYRLVHHLRQALKPLTHVHVEALQGRVRVSFADETVQAMSNLSRGELSTPSPPPLSLPLKFYFKVIGNGLDAWTSQKQLSVSAAVLGVQAD